jgi:putative spermidine/putrescine transport system ATP-binding protein
MRGADAASTVHVRFRNVSKRYGSAVLAVRDLHLDVFRGEFLTLLGPSGSGKTTALMMLAGFEEPSEGEILIDGQRIDKVPANRRGIGMVFQNYALFPHMTVAENLAFPLEVRKVPRPEIAQRVNAVLDMVRLAGVGSRRPDQLSGGQQQRIAVARALIFRPTLVLMDEPLGALDKQLREQMQYEIKDIHARLGVTFIYVTHDQTEALTMSDRIAVFNAGSIQQLSDPAALYERPQTDFVASFIGENNCFSGTLGPSEVGVVSVLLNGGALCIRAIMPKAVTAAAGARVTVSVRPERIAVLSDGASMPNEIGATVRSVIYVGDHLRLVSDVPGIGPIVVKLPNGSGLPMLTPGAEVRLGWRTEDCLALDS